ncbi:MAG TPA: hypothetical protein DDZ92_07110 [Halomonas sp.]|nr:hypothetical protein [Halomonas sp.]
MGLLTTGQEYFDPNTMSVENLVNQITAKGSRSMERANTMGQMAANRRGLLNSSLAGQSAQNAVIDAALPMAQADAAARVGFAMQGQGFDYNTALTAQRGNIEKDMQQAQFGFTGGQNALDRALQQTLQSNQFGFTRGENALDRGLQQTLQSNQFGFTSGENALDRGLQRFLQDSQFGFTRGENALDRDQQRFLQENQFGFQGAQADADRELQLTLQQGQQDFQSGENQAQRDFAGEESALDRAQRQNEINDANRISALQGFGNATNSSYQTFTQRISAIRADPQLSAAQKDALVQDEVNAFQAGQSVTLAIAEQFGLGAGDLPQFDLSLVTGQSGSSGGSAGRSRQFADFAATLEWRGSNRGFGSALQKANLRKQIRDQFPGISDADVEATLRQVPGYR